MDDRIRMTKYELSIFPEGSIYWLRDPYDNAIAKFFTTNQSKQLSITINADIEHRQDSAFDFLLDSHSLQFPFDYTETERQTLQPYLTPKNQDPLIEQWLKSNDHTAIGDTTEWLTNLLQLVHSSIRYERREESGIQAASETLHSGSGTCRDYAVLFIAICGHFGLASRFVSGYLYASSNNPETRGADALHAWTDVYLPGAGWRGLDPTNGIWCSNCHIPLAVSKNPVETTPIEGSYCAKHPVSSRMKTHLNIQNPSCKDGNM